MKSNKIKNRLRDLWPTRTAIAKDGFLAALLIIVGFVVFSLFRFNSFKAFEFNMSRWVRGIPVVCEPFNEESVDAKGCWSEQLMIDCTKHDYMPSCHQMEAEVFTVQYFNKKYEQQGGFAEANLKPGEYKSKYDEVYEGLRDKWKNRDSWSGH